MSYNVVETTLIDYEPAALALARMMAIRDRATQVHAERVQSYARALAEHSGVTDMAMLEAIHSAALLHDIGKLAIPDRLLHKPGPLTSDEYDEVKCHAAIGADMLEGLGFPRPLARIVRHHHENWDGSGYPNGLQQNEIPVGSRVLALVDCYDALTSPRPYRRALAHHTAIAMIHERRGKMYDPSITDAFLRIVWRFRPASTHEQLAARRLTKNRALSLKASRR